MVIHFGANGSGKTMAAYAMYAFSMWLANDFNLELIPQDQFSNVIKKNQVLKITYTEIIDRIRKQASSQFNSLDETYFERFFNDQSPVNSPDFAITVNDSDVSAFIIDTNKSTPEDATFRWSTQNKNEQIFEHTSKVTFTGSAVQIEHIQTVSQSYDKASGEILDENITSRILPPALNQHIFRQFVPIADRTRMSNSRRIVYFPAERIGINAFRHEINENRLQKVNEADVFSDDYIRNGISFYPRPIQDYLSFLDSQTSRAYRQLKGDDLSLGGWRQLIPGTFSYSKDTDKIAYTIAGENSNEDSLDFQLLSSSLKSLYGIDLFLKVAISGDWLFVDEPEMNLDPTNQIEMADFLYKLMQQGIKIVLSTHSSYFIRAIVNNVLKDKLEKKSEHQVLAYEFAQGSAKNIGDIASDQNASLDNFDAPLRKLDDDYYDLLERLSDESRTD